MTYRGFSLVEVLVAGVIASVIAMGSLYSLKFALQAGTVSRSVLTETDFKLSVRQALKEDVCTVNLRPKSDADKEKTVIPVTSLKLKSNDPEPIIEIGTFKGDIEVVKMEVRARDKTSTNREFIAYYKKNNIGKLNTVAGEICGRDPNDSTKFKLDGCYTEKCSLNYILGDNPDTPATETDFFSCEAQACHPVVLHVAGSRFPCKWGELYRPGENPPCDKREKTAGGCDKPTGSVFLSGGESGEYPDLDNDKTNRVEDKGKCVCKAGTSENAEGLCISDTQLYSLYECWPRNPSSGGDYGVTKEQIKDFCSEKYQGRQVCLKGKWTTGNSVTTVCKKRAEAIRAQPAQQVYYKRVYNRETGKVRCLIYNNCRAGSNQNPPPDTWFMPQTH